MDREGIIAVLRESAAAGGGPGNPENPTRLDALNRLIAAITSPRSFDELEWELPPEPRYLGPGIWMDAIRDAAK
ncbi:MAG: hypothetical protein LBQ38_04230 [Spirochaetaceae bacterium]|jgi:hypothetical protein|nr:hypothetical protein [Spirochaetaceae bacterium]